MFGIDVSTDLKMVNISRVTIMGGGEAGSAETVGIDDLDNMILTLT